MSQVAETHEFQAEINQLLDLMIHSLYTNKDVFLRELISNSSDALDKVRFEALTDEGLLPVDALSVQITLDPEKRTLTVEDNGIGMTRDEVLANIGTIAKSGTKEFLDLVQKSQGENKAVSPELIGQFGVGFYASFMVADKIRLVTKKAGTDATTVWESEGRGSFTVDEGERQHAGTTVTLHLKEADPEDGVKDYTDALTTRGIIKKYSDFVSYPIHLEVEGEETKEEDLGPVNSMKAIWTRPKDEVKEEELNEFYKHISHDWTDPLEHLFVHVEGTFEARALLFLPSKAPFDLYHREMAHRGIQLYIKRVFIMDECEQLMPNHFRFVRGVVDAEDLSLNVSREMLQQDRQIQAIRKRLVKKVHDTLDDLQKDDREKYGAFWTEFGPAVKEGLLDPTNDRDRLLAHILSASTNDASELTTLEEYVSRMKDDQEEIYFLVGESREVIENSPHLETFKARGLEVLLFTDRVDEVWLEGMPVEFQEKKLVNIGRGEIELGSEEERTKEKEKLEEKQTEMKDLLDRLRSVLQEEIKEVRLSSRLTESPACLVNDEGAMSPQIEAMLRQAGQEVPKVKRILEVNPEHVIVEKLRALHEGGGDGEEFDNATWLLYGQSVLSEGGRLEDPAGFGRRLAELMKKAL